MPGISDIVKDSVVEFSRLQNWKISAKENNDMNTYKMMFDRYRELKAILAVAGSTYRKLIRSKNSNVKSIFKAKTDIPKKISVFFYLMV